MSQISDANPGGPSAQAQPAPPQDPVAATDEATALATSFGARGRARRRVRFLRKARELAYRDLGGLVYNLHLFGQRNDPLVLDKLNTWSHRPGAEDARGVLSEHSPVTVLREAGITACPRCAAIHSSEDRFCPNCGIAMGRNADLRIAGGYLRRRPRRAARRACAARRAGAGERTPRDPRARPHPACCPGAPRPVHRGPAQRHRASRLPRRRRCRPRPRRRPGDRLILRAPRRRRRASRPSSPHGSPRNSPRSCGRPLRERERRAALRRPRRRRRRAITALPAAAA